MRPTRKDGIKPQKGKTAQNDNKNQDPVDVFCRLKPMQNWDTSCITLLSPHQLQLTPPSFSKHRKMEIYKFNHIFTEHADQKEIFEHIALPLLESVLKGECGLLFTYGVTGSGKTYTMTGEKTNPGIVPRCINTLFNSIKGYQTEKYLLKTDKMNGFEFQVESEIQKERMNEAKLKRKPFYHKSSEVAKPFLFSDDGIKVEIKNTDFLYSVFISYIEIYNNSVYDLLDDSSNYLQTKILKEDVHHRMFVHTVTEIEVKSAEETFDLYVQGNNKKRMGQTNLNNESSRSHSIFTIRVIEIPKNYNKIDGEISIINSQLSLVDLAGSERSSRTNNSGERLKEAGNINNSLMTLRNCLEILRNNQQNLEKRLVPYRESRLTYLFKNYFEGEGKVRMILCVNPTPEDFDETVHVMKFAEMTQEVQVTCPETRFVEVKSKEKKLNNKESSDMESEPSIELNVPQKCFVAEKKESLTKTSSSIMSSIPKITSFDPETNEIKDFIIYLKTLRSFEPEDRSRDEACEKFRKRLVNMSTSLSKYEKMKSLLPIEREKNKALNAKLCETVFEYRKALEQSRQNEIRIEELQKTIEKQNFMLKQNMVEKAKQKKKLEQVSEKMTHELDSKLRKQREYLQAHVKEQTDKIELVKNILSNKVPTEVTKQFSSDEENVQSATVATSTSKPIIAPKPTITPKSVHVSRRDTPVSNIRYRRSKSTDVWLEHRSAQPVPLGTILQPNIKCRKSTSKLTSVKDIINPKQNKYVLYSQGQDEEGDLETKLYKGDIIPTCSGGAQVIFDDVEKLKQESPVRASPRTPSGKKRTSTELVPVDTEDKCAFGIEGHSKKLKL